MLKHLPNALTCCNLLCGCLAILQAMHGHLYVAGYFVGAALVFDFLDGFAARKLHVSSPIGKDLDSLADLVTFGLTPGIVIYMLINIACGAQASRQGSEHVTDVAYAGLIIPLFSALRLAKFNNDPRQSDSFFGLPTPANAMVICSLPFIAGTDDGVGRGSWLLHPWLLAGIAAVMSLLLVSELPLFALKFRNFTWRDNRSRYMFLLCSGVLLLTLGINGVPLVILLYVAWSLVNKILSVKSV